MKKPLCLLLALSMALALFTLAAPAKSDASDSPSPCETSQPYDPDYAPPDCGNVTLEDLEVPLSGAQYFLDVLKGRWYEDAVKFVYENGLMSGVSDIFFAPDVPTTRAMLIVILHRLEGEPTPKNFAEPPFSDISSDAWYGDAIFWAADQNIANGDGSGLFYPDEQLTREQLAAIFMRYSQYKGNPCTERAILEAFADSGKVSLWAYDAMSWAFYAGLITGVSETELASDGFASRAQLAVILMRYLGDDFMLSQE